MDAYRLKNHKELLVLGWEEIISKPDNLIIEYTSQKEYVDALLTSQVSSAKLPDDYRTPFSFIEWKNRNIGIIPNQEYKQYKYVYKNINIV